MDHYLKIQKRLKNNKNYYNVLFILVLLNFCIYPFKLTANKYDLYEIAINAILNKYEISNKGNYCDFYYISEKFSFDSARYMAIKKEQYAYLKKYSPDLALSFCDDQQYWNIIEDRIKIKYPYQFICDSTEKVF